MIGFADHGAAAHDPGMSDKMVTFPSHAYVKLTLDTLSSE
jgi:hypothetical protein